MGSPSDVNGEVTQHLAHHGFEIDVDPDVHAGIVVVVHAEEDVSIPVASAEELQAILERSCPGESCGYEG